MRWTTLLILFSLFCLVGGAMADALSEAQYSRNQLLYLNGPDSGSFEQYTQRYWDSYIGNYTTYPVSERSPTTTMNIWLNNFPLSFDAPVKLGGSSFTSGGTGASNISPTLWNSMLLERETTSNFGLDRSWAYVPADQTTSFKMVDGDVSATKENSQGLILSQGIINLFGV